MSIFIFEVETEDFGAWFVLIRGNTLLEAEAKVTEKFPNDNVFAGEEISFDQDGVSQLIDPPSSRTLAPARREVAIAAIGRQEAAIAMIAGLQAQNAALLEELRRVW